MFSKCVSLAAGGLTLAFAIGPPGAAEAATPGTIPVDPSRQVIGTFSAPGTQTWNLRLERGKDYAVDGPMPSACFTVTVQAAGGSVLGRFLMSEDDQSDGPEGVSLRAPYGGLYTVVVTAGADAFASDGCGDGGSPVGYGLTAARDCPGNASTRCGIAVGGIISNLRLDYQGDADWFRTKLAAGHSYQATLTARYCNDFAVLDGNGKPLVQAEALLGIQGAGRKGVTNGARAS